VSEKIILFDAELCSGCMYCVSVCSTYNAGATSMFKSCIHIVRHEGHALTRINEEDDLIFDMITCQQCDEPYCMNACPVLAIKRDRESGVMCIDNDKCIGCQMCLASCPFGAIFYDGERKNVVKCEQCDGDPQCVKFCPTGALQFAEKEVAHIPKIDYLSRKLIQLQQARIKELKK
jgi:carbon-monoxide dehydrogenase iron sulfur subunit